MDHSDSQKRRSIAAHKDIEEVVTKDEDDENVNGDNEDDDDDDDNDEGDGDDDDDDNDDDDDDDDEQEEMYEEGAEEVDVEGEVEDTGEFRIQEDGSYKVVYPSRTSSISARSSQSLHDTRHLRMRSEEPGSSQSYSCETEQSYVSKGRLPAHVFAVRGNRIYRIDRAGDSTTTTPVRTVREKCYGTTVTKTNPDWHTRDMAPKSGSSRNEPVSPSLAYRTAQASIQHNRSFTPALSAKFAPKKRSLGSKKPCHCTRSMCLKLYCDCFANGEFCNECNCKDCKNKIEHEVERTRAIRLSLERNPNAFKPKIGVATNRHVEPERLHQKGCHCKKSNCLKNYCECYEAKVPCTDRCKCVTCRNTESDRAARFPNMKSLGPLSDIRTNAVTNNGDPQNGTLYSDEESDDDNREPSDPKTLPWFYMTDEVVEAAALCLVAQAEEMESNGRSTQQEIEKAILKEFGRCLGQVIESALKNAKKAAES